MIPRLFILPVLILILCIQSCSAQPKPFAVGKVIEKITCLSDTAESYALYIPAKGNTTALPVVYFFDPHGSGSLPLHKYKSSADSLGFILIGSNTSKNGNDFQYSEELWRIMSEDARKRLNLDPQRIYTAGFSGGAKVAGYVALHHPEIKGVLAMGAGLPDGTPAGNYTFSITAMAGEGDMNMTELVAINAAFDNTTTRHRIMLYAAKHEWAPATIMHQALTAFQFDAMFQKLIPVDEKLINAYITNSKNLIETLRKEGNAIKAVEQCSLTTHVLNGITNDTYWFTQKGTDIAASQEYKQQLQAQQRLLQTEQETKALYMRQFEQGDLNYWTKTIADLNKTLNAERQTQNAEYAMHQRLLAYLSLAFYSISNQQIRSNRNDVAQHFVNLYKLADPTNSEAWYFSALLHARRNEKDLAEQDLRKAEALGFTDAVRLNEVRNIGKK
jgi:pimeloyl-ACP methyl ester carboxylesterase